MNTLEKFQKHLEYLIEEKRQEERNAREVLDVLNSIRSALITMIDNPDKEP